MLAADAAAMPQKAPTKRFHVDGVECTVDANGLVNVGLNEGLGWKSDRFPVNCKALGGDIEKMKAKVRAHDRFPGLAARLKEQLHSSDDEGGKSAVQSILEPQTQPMDVELDDCDSRPASPVAFGDLTCGICEEVDTPAFDLLGGGFCCSSCVADSARAEEVNGAAEAQLAARAATAKQPPPTPPVIEPRRSERMVRPVVPVYDLNRGGKGQPGWSAYELGRLDSRHSRVRDESYSELQAARDKLQAEVETARCEQGDLAAQLNSVFGRLRELARPGDEMELGDCETAAAVILREAIVELLGIQESQAEEAAAASAPPWAPLNGSDCDSLAWTVDVPVRMGGVDGTPGELSVASGYVTWNPSSGASDDPWQQLPLCDIICADVDDHDEVRRATFRAAHTRAHGVLRACSTGCGDAGRVGCVYA